MRRVDVWFDEAHAKFGNEKKKEWLAEIKPKIEAVYSGKICVKGEWNMSEFPSYSCIAPTIEIPRNEEEKDRLTGGIASWSREARERNIELIIGEIWEGHNWKGTKEDAKRGVAMALEAGKGKVNGFFVLNLMAPLPPWIPLPFTTFQFKTFESVVREFYTQS